MEFKHTNYILEDQMQHLHGPRCAGGGEAGVNTAAAILCVGAGGTTSPIKHALNIVPVCGMEDNGWPRSR